MRNRSSTDARARGAVAERIACDYLRRRGLDLAERNFRVRGGEIDLVMRQDETLVFVEVRARRSNQWGTAAETVTTRKQRRLLLAAQYYLQSTGHVGPCRFDVVALTGEPGRERVDWIRDAFQL
ncbi:MAG: YraN family protein [Pseudomonadota bacterium]|nr:YraN family protein [Pseudomonadota bacterium]